MSIIAGTDKGVMVPQSCLPRGVIFLKLKVKTLFANGIFPIVLLQQKEKL